MDNFTRKPDKIIVHCSDSGFGNVSLIRKWHLERGWDDIGYHFVIYNGRPEHSDKYEPFYDGATLHGRSLKYIGAHCEGHNSNSIGVCLVGDYFFTYQQLFIALPVLIKNIIGQYGMEPCNVFPHRKFNVNKTCPNLGPSYFKYLMEVVV